MQEVVSTSKQIFLVTNYRQQGQNQAFNQMGVQTSCGWPLVKENGPFCHINCSFEPRPCNTFGYLLILAKSLDRTYTRYIGAALEPPMKN